MPASIAEAGGESPADLFFFAAAVIRHDIVEPTSSDLEARNHNRAHVLDVGELDAHDVEVVLVGVVTRQPVGEVHRRARDDVGDLLLHRRVALDPIEELRERFFVGREALPSECRFLFQLVELRLGLHHDLLHFSLFLSLFRAGPSPRFVDRMMP